MKHFLFMLLAFCILCGCSKDNNDDANDTIIVNDSDDVNNLKSVRDVDSSEDALDLSNYVANDPAYTIVTGNYMDRFFKPTSFDLRYTDAASDNGWADAIDPTFKVFFSYVDCYVYHRDDCSDVIKAKYNEYANYYGDTAYTMPHNTSVVERACLMPLYSINIVADKDFDEFHPAGITLNDLFTIEYHAFHSFINDGHKNIYGKDEVRQSYPMDSVMVVSDFKGVSLFQDGATLVLTKRPSAKGAYVFTFTLDFGADPLTGEKVEVPSESIEVEF